MANSSNNVAEALHLYDEAMRTEYPLLCGVDEAGRGPLCGPVSVGAVILNPKQPILGLNDSKKLNEKKREALYTEITETALAWAVVLVPPAEIDRLNILWATMLGMQQAVQKLLVRPDMVLIDGNRCPELDLPCHPVVKGDATSASIAAASILAKVTRDRYMQELDKQYPQYKLAQHKGYPTKLHYQLLEEHGLQDFYRKSFLKNRNFT
ncbi:ribonuclease HII [Ruminococcaceae bacterium OttesenSCG-928-A16]|nr:ribonuclease HII [Ruminococcaceae bacterium OttesenSCG-928-A16]